ncbi:MAG: DUF4923 family protein [Bacteroidales bacterium]|nr:DUF4923 family protein [Bacteroidales bacterium]
MKRTALIFTASLLIAGSTNAQNLGSLLKSATSGSTLGNVINNVAGAIYSAPISLNGTYIYQGSAVSVTSSEGGIISNLAGTAVTSGIEAKVDDKLAIVGIKPGSATFVFNNTDNTFTITIAGVPLSGTYKVGEGENTVNLTFGKNMKYLSMTGSLKSTASGCEMLFPANKFLAFVKKAASIAGSYSSEINTITSLASGYDNLKLGFKLSKQ